VTHVGSLKLADRYIDAVCREMDRAAALRPCGPLDTVYIGGGTPSMLEPAQIERLLRRSRELWGWAADAEISLEAHPATVDEARLHGYRAAGVTRLSMGAESMRHGELAELGRSHGPETVLRVLGAARRAGFKSVGVDLMYGLPGQSVESWRRGLGSLLEARPDHISLYPLSIEPRTVFAHRERRGLLTLPPDGDVAAMYDRACRLLRSSGYEHYEIANWSLPGRRCRHNLAYWHNHEFFAAGVGAHAYLHPHRTVNLSGTRRYIERIEAGESPVAERETLDVPAALGETVVLGLRLLQEGLDLADVRDRFGAAASSAVREAALPLIARGLLVSRDERLILPERLGLLGNEVWQRFVGLNVPPAPAQVA